MANPFPDSSLQQQPVAHARFGRARPRAARVVAELVPQLGDLDAKVSLSLPRVPQPGRTTILLRISGYGLIALVLPLAPWRDGPGFGSLLWACLLSVAACVVTITLSGRAYWLKPLARAAAFSGRAVSPARTQRNLS